MRRLLMGSGPSNPEPSVLQALGLPPLGGDDPLLDAVVDETSELIRGVFQTRSRRALPVQGASRAGLEAVMGSLVQPGERVLVGAFGHFGNLLATLAARAGAEVHRVDAEWGAIVEPDALVSAIRSTSPRVVAIVHADTSTGILQPLEGIGAACREQDALLVVDAVLSVGGAEVAADRLQIDAAVGGLQKCLGGPPGMALVGLGERVDLRPGVTASLDLERLACDWFGPRDPDTNVAQPMVYALRQALRLVHAEGLAERWQRHERAGHALAVGLRQMGLRLVGDPRYKAPMIALVDVPDGVSEPGVRAQLLDEHGVEIMAAFGPFNGRVWRIGSMGVNARLDAVLTVLGALEAVLLSRGVRLPPGEAVAAARETWVSRSPSGGSELPGT